MFRPAALAFFRDLAADNTKAWFEAHRAVYEREVREPMALLVEEVDARLGHVAPEITGTPKRNIFRIHRDVRFAADKSPYKTQATCWWGHRDAARGEEGAHPGAAFYFEIGVRGGETGGGTWQPERHTVRAIRQAIVDDPDAFQEIVTAPDFARTFGALDTDGMLQRLPRGYAADHPAERWLRYCSFTATTTVPARELSSTALPDRLVERFIVLLPLVRFLNRAQGLKAAERR